MQADDIELGAPVVPQRTRQRVVIANVDMTIIQMANFLVKLSIAAVLAAFVTIWFWIAIGVAFVVAVTTLGALITGGAA